MMLYFIIFLVISYVLYIVWVSKQIHVQFDSQTSISVKKWEAKYVKLQKEEEFLQKEKLRLEEEAIEIFTLYQLTKEITKNIRREEVVDVFKKELKNHVNYEECLFVEPLSDEYKNIQKSKEYYFFTVQNKKKKVGYLALRGVRKDDIEKVNILGHQFALILRRVELYKELERIAITDSLTELNTRRYTLERLEEEFKRSKLKKINLSFLMIDVDHFKTYNDKYGHLTGDQILREIGLIIRDNVREIDIAGRYGGEEFCVILPDTNAEGAKYAAERIRKATEKVVIKAYDAKVKVTLSIGVATFPEHAKKVDELVDKADWALYRAKKSGRNRVSTFGDYS